MSKLLHVFSHLAVVTSLTTDQATSPLPSADRVTPASASTGLPVLDGEHGVPAGGAAGAHILAVLREPAAVRLEGARCQEGPVERPPPAHGGPAGWVTVWWERRGLPGWVTERGTPGTSGAAGRDSRSRR